MKQQQIAQANISETDLEGMIENMMENLGGDSAKFDIILGGQFDIIRG